MSIRTVARDCLHLHWAVPRERLPEPPAPLRWDVRGDGGDGVVFASALLFRMERARLRSLPVFKLSHPQFHLRLCTLDGDGSPSFYLLAALTPTWALPGARLLERQPAVTGSFDFPRPGHAPGERAFHWSVRRRKCLEVSARAGSPPAGSGPSLGTWENLISYFQRRDPVYFAAAEGLRKIEIGRRPGGAVPLAAEVGRQDLLGECLELAGGWPPLHSAFFCPETPFVFVLGAARERALPRQLPAPG